MSFGFGKTGVDPCLPLGHLDADRGLAADDAALDLQRLPAAQNVLDLGRRGVLRNGDTGAGGVEKAHRLVGQLPRRDVAMRQADRRLDRLVEYLYLVVLFQHAGDTAQHENGHRLRRFVDLDHLETAGERRIFLDVLLVFSPGGCRDGAQFAARQRRLQEIGRIAGSCRTAGADQGVGFVDEQDDRRFGGLNLVDDRLQPLFEFALDAGARLHQSDVEHAHADALQRGRHVALGDAQGKALDDRGLADPGLAGQDRVVLPAPHQDIDDLPDLRVAADDRIDLAVAGTLGQVGGVFRQRRIPAGSPPRRLGGGSRIGSHHLRANLPPHRRSGAMTASASILSNSPLIFDNRPSSTGVFRQARTIWALRTSSTPNSSVARFQASWMA